MGKYSAFCFYGGSIIPEGGNFLDYLGSKLYNIISGGLVTSSETHQDYKKAKIGSRKMRKWVLLFLLLYPASIAFANPVIIPDPANIIVLGSAFFLEASIMTILLFFFHMSPVPVFLTLFAGNLGIYFVVFVPVLDANLSLLAAEMLIVGLEGTFIKLISLSEIFQLETFTLLKWKYAFIIAASGNIVSYYVGTVMGA